MKRFAYGFHKWRSYEWNYQWLSSWVTQIRYSREAIHSFYFLRAIPDTKVHGANMGPTWVLSAPDGPHVGPMNHAIRDISSNILYVVGWLFAPNTAVRQAGVETSWFHGLQLTAPPTFSTHCWGLIEDMKSAFNYTGWGNYCLGLAWLGTTVPTKPGDYLQFGPHHR